MRQLITLCLLCIGLLAPAAWADEPTAIAALIEDWHDAARDRVVPVKIDYPEDISKPLPVVILSHGLGGSRNGLRYIGQYWAAHGYVAVHLQHPGSDETVWKGVALPDAVQGMKQAVSVEQFSARVADVKFALDELARRNGDPAWPLHGKLDLQRIAMAGHSFGAVTTQAICGQSYPGDQNFFDPRIKVGISLSPNPPKGDAGKAFASVTIPMLYWTGTKDDGPLLISTVKAIERRIPFDATTRSDAYLVILTGAEHMVFDGSLRANLVNHPQYVAWHEIIQRGTTAFLDKYLKRDAAQAKYLDGDGFAGEVKPLGTFEKKLKPTIPTSKKSDS